MSQIRKIRRRAERRDMNKTQRAIAGLLAPKHCHGKLNYIVEKARKAGK